MSDVRGCSIFRDRALEMEFDRDGYCVSSHAELRRMVGLASAVFQERADAYKAVTFRSTFQIADLSHRFAVHSSLTGIFDVFIKNVMLDCRIVWAGFAVKQPSGALGYIPLHQDFSMCDVSIGRAPVTAWIPLQDTNEKTGGMIVIPKERFFDATARAYGEKKEWQYKVTIPALLAGAIALNVSLGKILFFHNALLHCSAGNFGSSARVAVILVVLPREQSVRLFRSGKKNGKLVSDDFYVKYPLK